MNPNEVILACHEANSDIADSLSRTLAGSGYTLKQMRAAGNELEHTLAEQLGATNLPTLMLISDNFLKSANCLEGMLPLANDASRKITYIFTEGKASDPETGETYAVPTVIDRIGDMIRYITFWHDQTLEIRNTKSSVSGSDMEDFQEYFRRIREIANDAGEFLRLLRSSAPLTLDEFTANDFQAFFVFLDDQEAWQKFQESPPVEVPVEAQADLTLAESAPPETGLTMNTPHIHPEAAENDLTLIAEPVDLEPSDMEQNDAMGQDSQQLIKQGIKAFDEGRFEEGISIIGQVVELNPGDNDLRYHYAMMLAHNDQHLDEAVDQLKLVLEVNPSKEEALMLSGRLAEQQQRFSDAKGFFQRVLELNPQHPEVHYKLANIMLNHFEDQADEAARHLLEGAEQHTDNAEKLFRYARMIANLEGYTENAEALFRQVLDLQPDHAPSYLELAHLLKHQHAHEAAWEAYQQAVQFKPELATSEWDIFFALPEPEPIQEPPVESPTIIPTPKVAPMSEQEAIKALIDNIHQLQSLLEEKQKQAQSKEVNHAKIVLITGASSGIGKATANAFAAEGYRLILNARRGDKLAALKAELEAAHQADIILMPFDITQYASVAQAWEALPEDWKSVDVLVNNAGKAKGLAPIHEGELRHWEEMIDTNLKGLLYITRLVTPQMVARKTGHIVNVSSTAGKDAYPNGNVYCATKFAVEALTKTMRLDLHKYGIRVSQVAPGHVEETEFALVRFDGDAERAKIYEDFKPLSAQDVADAILYMVNRPPHVNVQDILLMSTQQASATIVDRSGR